jgi:hypothetical protein
MQIAQSVAEPGAVLVPRQYVGWATLAGRPVYNGVHDVRRATTGLEEAAILRLCKVMAP